MASVSRVATCRKLACVAEIVLSTSEKTCFRCAAGASSPQNLLKPCLVDSADQLSKPNGAIVESLWVGGPGVSDFRQRPGQT